MLTKDTKLRFWCQKVLPLVYDDSLSYYELLNKVVLHLNQHTEDINALIDFYNTFAEDVEDIIRQMMDDGDFNEIVANTIGSLIAEEYDQTKSYIIFDYCIFESKLYRANGSTTGVFDPEKWDEKTVGYDLTTIQNYIYSLNAGNVAYDPTASYDSGTAGNKIKNLNADINTLNDAITAINTKLTKMVTAEDMVNASYTIPTTYSSLGAMFTLTKQALVTIAQTYSNALPLAIGVKASTSNYDTSRIYCENTLEDENVAGLRTTGLLPAGTYYVWARAKASQSNPIYVQAYYFE